MLRPGKSTGLLILGGLLVLLGACSPTTATPTAPPPAPDAATVPSPTLPVSTATLPALAPSVTPLSSSPTAATPPPLAVSPGGFSAWCKPQGAPDAKEPWFMPAYGKTFTSIYGVEALIIPAASCTFIFTFNQPIADDITLEVYDRRPTPWLTAELTPVADTNIAYTTLRNSYIIDPPFWQINYRFVVRDTAGGEVWSGEVIFDRGYRPELCWDGSLPNPLTLRCRWEKELHPWDPEYRTPAPED